MFYVFKHAKYAIQQRNKVFYHIETSVLQGKKLGIEGIGVKDISIAQTHTEERISRKFVTILVLDKNMRPAHATPTMTLSGRLWVARKVRIYLKIVVLEMAYHASAEGCLNRPLSMRSACHNLVPECESYSFPHPLDEVEFFF